MFKYILLNKSKFNNIYLKSPEKAKKKPEYIHNEMQINCIKDILIERAFVPKQLIDLLIESVEENVKLEYEVANNSFVNKIK